MMTRRPRKPVTTLLACGLLLFAAEESWALRCGNRLITEGMHDSEVIALCGEPDTVRQLGFVLRPVVFTRPYGKPGYHSQQYVYAGFHQELDVKEMLFNFGPHKLMRVIRFEGGRLTSIDTAGYGYRDKNR
jgi:hypothetical protein